MSEVAENDTLAHVEASVSSAVESISKLSRSVGWDPASPPWESSALRPDVTYEKPRSAFPGRSYSRSPVRDTAPPVEPCCDLRSTSPGKFEFDDLVQAAEEVA